MKTELNPRKTRVYVIRAGTRKDIDPEEIWLDQNTTPEELLELDPFEITYEMVRLAEHPQLADRVLMGLPRKKFRLSTESVFIRKMKAELREMHRKNAGAPQDGRRVPFRIEGSV